MRMRPIQPLNLSNLWKDTTKNKQKLFNELKTVPENLAFVLRDGNKLRTLKELADALYFMDNATFMYHVNEHKNDFAKWIKDVHHEYELAEKLFRSESKEEHQIIILRHILDKLGG